MSGFGVFWRVFGVPDYHFTALDPYGQETTGQFSADDSEAAAERVKEMGLFATEISELTGESRVDEPVGLLAGLNNAWHWMLFGVLFPCVSIRFALQPPEELIGKQWFVIPIMMGLSIYTVWHRLKKGEWPESPGEGGGG